MLKTILKAHGRHQPNELMSALLALSPSELVKGLVKLFSAGELRFRTKRRVKNGQSLCQQFYDYNDDNPQVAGWFLKAAQKERHRSRYSIGALTEEIRYDIRMGVIKAEDSFKIPNELRALFARLVVMRDPSLCGLFKINPSVVDDLLVIDGCSWSEFARQHHAELWPGVRRKPPRGVGVVERAA
jgi:hypothetical protein